MSSIDPTAYDSLGRIMSSGGEVTLALAMSRGYSGSQISSIMSRKFGSDYAASEQPLSEFATAMITAAERANQLQANGGEMNLSEIPLNGVMQSDEIGPARFRWTADVTFEGATSAVTVYGYGSSANVADLLDEALSAGLDIVDNYRNKFGLGDDSSLAPLSVQFTSIERQY